jgi:hypothetical protein
MINDYSIALSGQAGVVLCGEHAGKAPFFFKVRSS